MKTTYSNNAKDSFMVIELEGYEKYPEKDLGAIMIEKNRPGYILDMTRVMMDGKETLRFRTTGMISVCDRFSQKQMGLNEVKSIIHAISKMASDNVRYLISTDKISLDPGNIFTEAGDGRPLRAAFVYVPFKEESFRESLQGLMEYVLEHLDHSDEEAVEFAYGLYEAAYCEGFTLSAWEEERIKIQKESINTAQPEEPFEKEILPYCSVTAYMSPDKVEFTNYDTKERFADCKRNIAISDLPPTPSYGRVKERNYFFKNGLGVYLWRKITGRSSTLAYR